MYNRCGKGVLQTWQGNATSAALESAVFPNGSAIANASAPGGRGTRQLYGLFWQLRGGECRCACTACMCQRDPAELQPSRRSLAAFAPRVVL